MKFKSNLLLLLAAAIWGFAFVAQRVGMNYIGPFTFTGVRFALGSLSLLPLILLYKTDSRSISDKFNETWRSGLLAGLILFIAVSLQQIGLVYTTAGKAAFITCLYIVLVPIAGVFLKQLITVNVWIGSILAVVGLYFLCVTENFTISFGDLLELLGACFWTVHILLIDRFARKVDTLNLAFFQFITCSILSLGVALLFETNTINGILQAAVPILYGGLCSVGIAYTLQIVGQKNASPSHAAIILSMETVFAAIGGYIILNEILGLRELLGCTLMMAGMLMSQLQSRKLKKNEVLAE